MSDKNNEDLKRQASENTLGLNPVIGIRGKDLLTSARMVLAQALKQPFHSAKHVAHFGLELKNVMLGQSALKPEDGDRRFNDPTWSQNPCIAVICRPTWPGARSCMTGSSTVRCPSRTPVAATSSST